jgi:phosphoribosylanthranilate isomerase
MSVLVKICGLSTPETLDVALDGGADLVGFVFFPASPRNVTLAQARELGARVNRRAEKVALAVDPDDRLIEGIVDALKPDVLQLHGHETPERVADIRKRFGVPVMKVLPVAEAADLAAASAFSGVADRLLFDARPPRDATRPGGLGRSFDWRLLRGIQPGTRFMLSGGLDAENVAEALAITRAAGVDVSSGVERAPGQKDPDKIRAFIRAARDASADEGHDFGAATGLEHRRERRPPGRRANKAPS